MLSLIRIVLTKTADTLKSDILTTLTNYNTNTLTQFDGVFRYSKVTGLIDNTDIIYTIKHHNI